jgi:16S rRNA (cytidine1402-2'-O)-methyltransferase
LTVVVAGAPPGTGAAADPATLAASVADRVAAGHDRKTAIASVARAAGVPKRVVYDAVVASRSRSVPGCNGADPIG